MAIQTDRIDRSRPEPLYSQIKSWISAQINSRQWPVHFKLPSEEDLARDLGVSRGTLRQAIQELIAERRLIQVHGKGTFVVSDTQIEGHLADQLTAFSEELILQGISFQTEVMDQQIIAPDARTRALLNLSSDQDVFYLARRRTVDGAPIIVTRNFVPSALCPGILEEDFTQQRLFACLETQYILTLSWARRTFEVRAADPELAELLALPVGAPLMYIEQIVYLEDGTPAECSDIWLRGDRFKLSSMITRDGKQTMTHAPNGE